MVQKKQKWEKSIFEPVLDIVDFSGTYKLTFIAYLYSYFLYQKIDRRLLSGVLDYVFPKACFASSEIARFEKIFRNAFTISNVIRIREHGLYFQIFMDSDRSIENLCDFDFMSVLEKNEILMKSLEKIISLAHFGPQKKSLSVVSSQKIKVPA